MSRFLNDKYSRLEAYVPGEQPQDMEYIKLNTNESPFPPSPEVIKAVSFPAGVLDKIDLVVYDKDLKAGDTIIMCSDGILESNTEYENKELWLKNLLENIETGEPEKIANIIMQEAIDNGLGIAKDDMTVMVAKLENK